MSNWPPEFEERMRRARDNVDAWTREFATAVMHDNRARRQHPPNIIPFPLERTRRLKGGHSYEWKG